MKKISKVAILTAALIMASTVVFAKSKKKKDADKTPKAEPSPQWVDSPTAVYPVSTYFQAVGTGADRTSAELAAVRGIAAVFGQNVASTTQTSKRMEQAMQDGKMVTATVSGISQDTASKVNLDDVIGVEVMGYWQNVKEGNWMAIAVLDKPKVSIMYTSMIQQNDKEVRELINTDETDTAEYFTFETYARLDLAYEIAKKDEEYLTRLQVINPTLAASLRNECISSKQVKGKTLEIAKAIPIGITAEGDREGRIKTAFANAVSTAGFRTSDKTSERYMITVTMSFDRHDTKDGTTVQCRYNVDAPLKDTVMDEVLLPYALSGRESGTDWDGAQYSTYKALEKKIKSAFTKAFKEYAASVAAY